MQTNPQMNDQNKYDFSRNTYKFLYLNRFIDFRFLKGSYFCVNNKLYDNINENSQ